MDRIQQMEKARGYVGQKVNVACIGYDKGTESWEGSLVDVVEGVYGPSAVLILDAGDGPYFRWAGAFEPRKVAIPLPDFRRCEAHARLEFGV